MASLRDAQAPRFVLAVLVLMLTISSCVSLPVQPGGSGAASPSLEPVTLVALATVRASDTATLAATPSATPTRPPTATPTLTASPTWTPTPTVTATPADTPSPTPTLGPTPDGIARQLKVPILMYHYIAKPPAGADAYRRDLSVAPERFAEQMRYLRDAGYSTVTLDDLLYALALGRPLPPKPIILTFDDGYTDNYENAFPVLRENGFVGTFFIMTDLATDKASGYLTWPQIEEMAAAGQRFGSHGRQDHRTLAGRSLDYLVWTALGSKEAIEEHLGYHPRWIAYPSGEYDAQTIAVFRSAGYWGGLTIDQGAENSLDKIFELRRIRVRGSHTAQDLAGLLAIDW